jgi:P-type Ca2+ transporter type 2C
MDSSAPSAHQQSAQAVLQALAADTERGLSASEVTERQARFGPNELRGEPPTPAWRKFLTQFEDTLVLLLLAATAVSTALWAYEGHSPLPYEAMAILAVVLFNAIMGYLQESRAESAVAALNKMTAAQASVLRDGERHRVPAVELVPGDILVIEEGDTVAADARVLEAVSLQTAEAALTGESLPVSKQVEPIAEDAALGDRDNMIWSGTNVTYGRGRAVVVATGMDTEMGRIAGMLHGVETDKTPLQAQLDSLGKRLGLVVVAIAVIMIGTIVGVEDVSSFSALVDVFILGVALAVAAVPEGLPAVVTAVLSLGVQRMAKRKAIVRHLRAVETLGSADVIASDKTGTLTKNEMTVRALVTASGSVALSGTGYTPEGKLEREDGQAIQAAHNTELLWALRIGESVNNAQLSQQSGRWQIQGDPTEGALLVAARKAAAEGGAERAAWQRVAEVPFSSERKRMSTLHRDAQQQLLVLCKGAPDVVLQLCTSERRGERDEPLSDTRRQAILDQNEALASRGLRTLGVAFRKAPEGVSEQQPDAEAIERELCFAGVFGILDPPRAEAKVAVAKARAAGIRAVMITGDHPKTAVMIASELGMIDEPKVATGNDLRGADSAQLDKLVQTVSVFARVDPEHKLRIVEALERQGAVVAMTGDGVNDAPALKTADIGVAMGITGTDVSKQAADMVLADDNFATIVAAVEEGRAIFANIRKFLRYLLSSNIGEVMTMFFGVVLSKPLGLHAQDSGVVLPLVATQLLWINMVTDGAPALALGVDPPDEGLMDQPPRPTREPVITLEMWLGIGFVGLIMAAVTLYALDAGLPGGFIEGSGTLAFAQTMAFNTLMLCQVWNVFNARSDTRSAFVHLFHNRFLWIALGVSIVAQFAVLYLPPLQRAFSTVPLSLSDWLECLGLASLTLIGRELSKLVVRARHSAPASAATSATNQSVAAR